jgi:hypothetical protein
MSINRQMVDIMMPRENRETAQKRKMEELKRIAQSIRLSDIEVTSVGKTFGDEIENINKMELAKKVTLDMNI